MRELLPRRLGRGLTLLRGGWRVGVSWSIRITVAAVAGYVVGRVVFPDTQPLLASLTAMLVVQVTPVSLLASGLDRVVAVVTGVVLAVFFVSVVPLEWWSLGLLIFVSMAVGQVLRLRDNLIEVPVSAMLVLGVGGLGADRGDAGGGRGRGGDEPALPSQGRHRLGGHGHRWAGRFHE